jgi:hypothetical protein
LSWLRFRSDVICKVDQSSSSRTSLRLVSFSELIAWEPSIGLRVRALTWAAKKSEQSQPWWEEDSAMAKTENETSQILEVRVADLASKMRSAQVTEDEMRAFQKVAALMGGGAGSLRLNADDLIAASFVAEALSNSTPRQNR